MWSCGSPLPWARFWHWAGYHLSLRTSCFGRRRFMSVWQPRRSRPFWCPRSISLHRWSGLRRLLWCLLWSTTMKATQNTSLLSAHNFQVHFCCHSRSRFLAYFVSYSLVCLWVVLTDCDFGPQVPKFGKCGPRTGPVFRTFSSFLDNFWAYPQDPSTSLHWPTEWPLQRCQALTDTDAILTWASCISSSVSVWTYWWWQYSHWAFLTESGSVSNLP